MWDRGRGRAGQAAPGLLEPWQGVGCAPAAWGRSCRTFAGHPVPVTPPRKFGTGSVLAGGDGEVRAGFSPPGSSCRPAAPRCPGLPGGLSPTLLLGRGTKTLPQLWAFPSLSKARREPLCSALGQPDSGVTPGKLSGSLHGVPGLSLGRPASPPCHRPLGVGFLPRWKAGCR